jgi:hypothetical protein
VTNAGLAQLRPLKQLVDLQLTATQISDAGLLELTELPNLKRIHLRGTQVTDAGIDAFNKAAPNVQISR